jgi:hypothetical protein
MELPVGILLIEDLVICPVFNFNALFVMLHIFLIVFIVKTNKFLQLMEFVEIFVVMEKLWEMNNVMIIIFFQKMVVRLHVMFNLAIYAKHNYILQCRNIINLFVMLMEN